MTEIGRAAELATPVGQLAQLLAKRGVFVPRGTEGLASIRRRTQARLSRIRMSRARQLAGASSVWPSAVCSLPASSKIRLNRQPVRALPCLSLDELLIYPPRVYDTIEAVGA